MNIQQQLRGLVERHHANFTEQIAVVARLLGQSGHGSVARSRIAEAQAITHQMKGTAGSMGFREVGAAAAALDESLKLLKALPDPITPEQRRHALELLHSLQGIAARTTPEMSTLYNADLSKLSRH
jgi:HPt (histidine-containing phosphotransfer) domain-containing protein